MRRCWVACVMRDHANADTAAPILSVVVIGRNEGERLVRCLESVQRADTAGHVLEIIYVDSASVDGSPERAVALGAKVLTVRPKRPSAATGRNAGWRAASGDLVLFLDGDTVLAAEFIPAALQEMARCATTAVVWGHRRELAPADSIFNRVLDLDWIYAPGTTDFCGGDALFQRAALVQSGGFNDSLIAGEEPELCARLRALGYRIRHIDTLMTGHDLAIRHWRQYWRRAERAGHAYAEVSTLLAGHPTPLWSREAKRNIQHGGLMIGASAALVILALAQAWGAVWLLLSAATVIVVRSAWRSRWKSTHWLTLLAYGIHSHLQQIPILWGQLLCRQALRRGQGRHLIEYKGPQA
jgi:glycosyltransferase involved in cell wall biosynthesis